MPFLTGVILLLAGDNASDPPQVPQSPIPAIVRKVESFLEANPDLLNHHRGYLSILDASPDLDGAETAYNSLNILSSFSALMDAFEEKLSANPASHKKFSQYNAFLAKNPATRRADDALQRFQLTRPSLRTQAMKALDYLKANPDWALQFLNGAATPGGPDNLLDLRAEFRGNPALRETLKKNFLTVHEDPAAHTDLMPWWKTLGNEEDGLAPTYRQVRDRLMVHPDRFWVWRQRNIALADHTSVDEWVRYFHRRVRREPELGRDYWSYLQLLKERPELKEHAEKRWRSLVGPPRPWPPPMKSPTLRPRTKKVPDSAVRRPEVKRPPRPKSPQVRFPTRPQRPQKPVRQEPQVPKSL